jgi:hypothetical protein
MDLASRLHEKRVLVNMRVRHTIGNWATRDVNCLVKYGIYGIGTAVGLSAGILASAITERDYLDPLAMAIVGGTIGLFSGMAIGKAFYKMSEDRILRNYEDYPKIVGRKNAFNHRSWKVRRFFRYRFFGPNKILFPESKD